MAVASKTLKITHLDLASGGADLGASGAEAWARFPARDRFGTGRLGCWHNLVAGLTKICSLQIKGQRFFDLLG